VLIAFDKTLMSYDHEDGLATTWATSVARLTPNGRRLLERLAFLAPEPIPDSLLDVAVDGDPPDFDAKRGRGNLFAYSLISRAQVETGKASKDGFAVHRLVQDFTRRDMTEERRGAALREALEWVDAAFVGDPADVRTWPLLDPLASQALAVVAHGDTEGIVAPTARLYGELGQLFNAKARYAEAESMSRRALAIDEARYGPDHPTVAIRLNNLAQLLKATNRLDEAEPMMRRALRIFEASYAPDHPYTNGVRNNLAALLKRKN
jgi:tetratricopeptide (TPR) repeat protein